MTIMHHPDPSTLMSFAAGTLGEALSAVVASHIDLCPVCRLETRKLEVLGGVLLGQVAAVTVSTPHLSKAKPAAALGQERAGHGRLPTTVDRLVGGDLERVAWTFVSPGVHVCKLPLSAASEGLLVLIKIAAGRGIPEHGHGGSELTLVLKGSFSDKSGRYARGDVSDLDEEAEHEPVADLEGECICLFASESKLKFKGVLPRLLQPIIGI